ncbi:MAG: Spy/CpxP family protein refolding chaperone [Deltaproteobacteria bacterium]|nr:Spy/CpxP family protein refolding chaperone [Deltaproteobacteria bacterium]
MKRQLAVMLISAVTLLSSSDVLARGGGRHGFGPGPHMGGPGCGAGFGGPGIGLFMGLGPRVISALGLNEDQQKQIEALRAPLVTEMNTVREQMQTKHNELITLWQAVTPDRNAILAKTSEINTLREQIHTAHIDFRLAVLKLLSNEQREKLNTFVGKIGKRGKGLRGNYPFANRGGPNNQPGNVGPCPYANETYGEF